jgi:hypothetical protein
MFLKSVTELAIDFRDVRAAMLNDPRMWLAGPAEAAGRDGDQLLVNVGLAGARHEVGHGGRLEVGEAMTTGLVAELPLHIRVVDDTRLFPSLEGSLEASWLGRGRTHLAVCATYESPFSLADRGVDRTLLHRVTEAVLQGFLEAVARELAGRTPAALSAAQAPAGFPGEMIPVQAQ